MGNEQKLLSFSELNLGFGQKLDLLPKPGEKDVIFACELIGCLPGESIIIGPSESGLLPRMVEGQRVVVRVKLPGGIALFPSIVLFVSEVPTVMVYLDYPRDIKFRQVRGALRVNVSQPVLAYNLSDTQHAAIPGKIVDISTSGARLEMFELLGTKGDKLELKGKFAVGEVERKLSIEATIRMHKQEGESHIYGIEFSECEEDKLLVLLGFTFHALAFGKAQTIR